MKKRITTTIFALALLLCAVPASVFATPGENTAAANTVIASGICGAEGGNVTWALYESGLLKISGRGAMKDYTPSTAPWWDFADQMVQAVIEDGVTSIGNHAFNNGELSFHGYNNLTSVTIPDSVTVIGNYAFVDCIKLTSVTIPDSVTAIGFFAFDGCISLTSVTLPANITTIDDYTFVGCRSLTSVTIPDSVTAIRRNAFARCSRLASITIPDSVTYIGDQAFMECGNLTSVTIPEGIDSIGYEEFCSCTSLTSVTIPESVTTVDIGAFYNCPRLTDVYYGGTEEQWEQILIRTYNLDLIKANIHYGCTGTEPEELAGDVDGSGGLNADDAIYLLYHALFGDLYPVAGDCDFDGNGTIDADDAIYLLYHTLFGDSLYPLN